MRRYATNTAAWFSMAINNYCFSHRGDSAGGTANLRRDHTVDPTSRLFSFFFPLLSSRPSPPNGRVIVISPRLNFSAYAYRHNRIAIFSTQQIGWTWTDSGASPESEGGNRDIYSFTNRRNILCYCFYLPWNKPYFYNVFVYILVFIYL